MRKITAVTVLDQLANLDSMFYALGSNFCAL